MDMEKDNISQGEFLQEILRTRKTKLRILGLIIPKQAGNGLIVG